jgi:hypothetical protein
MTPACRGWIHDVRRGAAENASSPNCPELAMFTRAALSLSQALALGSTWTLGVGHQVEQGVERMPAPVRAAHRAARG